MLEPDEHLRRVELKILVLGSVGVGKTSLVQRFCYNHFSKQYKSTVGLDFAVKEIEWQNQYLVTLQLCDISGQERFVHLTRVVYKNTDAAVILFDLTEPASLDRALMWKQELDDKLPNVPCLLLGNKCDADTTVMMDDILGMCKLGKFSGTINVSAKNDVNTTRAFHQCIRLCMPRVPPTPRYNPITPRSAQHQYTDRPSPRYKNMHRDSSIIFIDCEKSEEEDCCWML